MAKGSKKPSLRHRDWDEERHRMSTELTNLIGRPPVDPTQVFNLLDDDAFKTAREKQAERHRIIVPVEHLSKYRKDGLSDETLDFVSQFSPEAQEELLHQFGKLHSKEEEYDLLIMLTDYIAEGRTEKLNAYIKYDYEYMPVPMEEFLESKDFLNLKGKVYPQLKSDLCELFDPKKNYIEAVFTGSIGWGKSYLSGICISRMIYELSCLRSPQTFYGLDDHSTITFINMSVTITQALKGVYEYVKQFVRLSPYFTKYFGPDKRVESELRFPKSVLCMATANPLGYNVYGGVIDEINFMPVVSGSKKARGIADDVYDHAQVVYQALVRRQKSRFMKRGQVPGKLILSSSKQYPDDFLERKIAEAKEDPSIFVLDYAEWEPKPQDNYCGQTFRVLVGGTMFSSRIMEADEVPPPESKIVNVPVEYQKDFERDIEGSIRDIAGISVLAIEPLISQRHKISEAIDKSMPHAFSVYQTTLKDDGDFIPSLLKPKRGCLYFAHIDLAVSHDSAGVCIGHIEGSKAVKRRVGGKEYDETAPIIKTDLILRILPPIGGEIDIEAVRGILYRFADAGYEFGKITYDQFQSKESLQELVRRGYIADHRSVEDYDAYKPLKLAFYENRLILHNHPVMFKEFIELEHNKAKGKVDHRPNGCFTGDTRIALLDGTLPTFEELARKFGTKKRFAVYTIGEGGVTVGMARNPRITRRNAEIMEVVLDNFQVIKCTPDHLFMLTDGNYVQAQNLTTDMSLMPLYRTRTQRGGWVDYEKYYDPVKRQSDLLTHRMVAEWRFGEMPEDCVVHHINSNKGDNDPANLELDNRYNHARRHTTERHKNNEAWVQSLRDGHARYRQNGGNQKSRENILRLFEQGKLKRGRKPCSIEGCLSLSDAGGMCGKHYQWHRRQKLRNQNHRGNHRILNIRLNAGTADVWDITVDGTHNFALASGVFVHNSKDVADAVCGMYNNAHESFYQGRGVLSGLGDKPTVYTPNGLMDRDLALLEGGDFPDVDEIDDYFPR